MALAWAQTTNSMADHSLPNVDVAIMSIQSPSSSWPFLNSNRKTRFIKMQMGSTRFLR